MAFIPIDEDEFEGLLEPEGAQDMIIERHTAARIEGVITSAAPNKREEIRTILHPFRRDEDVKRRILNNPEFHALTAVVRTGQNQLISFLVAQGADVLSFNSRGVDSFTTAVQSRNTTVLPELFSRIPQNVGSRLNIISKIKLDILREMGLVEDVAELELRNTIDFGQFTLIYNNTIRQLDGLSLMLEDANRIEGALRGGQLRTQFRKKKVNKKSRNRK